MGKTIRKNDSDSKKIRRKAGRNVNRELRRIARASGYSEEEVEGTLLYAEEHGDDLDDYSSNRTSPHRMLVWD